MVNSVKVIALSHYLYITYSLSSQKLHHKLKMNVQGRILAEQYLHSLPVSA
jgi:hypothetical protein